MPGMRFLRGIENATRKDRIGNTDRHRLKFESLEETMKRKCLTMVWIYDNGEN